MIRTGLLLDEWGRPMRSLLRDEGPSRARLAPGRGTLNGNLVVGRSGAKIREEGAQSAEAKRTRAFRERHGGRKAS
jgi:hypothetical protein